MKMRINLNQTSIQIRIPFFALFSAIIDFKSKLNASEVKDESRSQEIMEDSSNQENRPTPKKFKYNFKKVNFNFIKKINFENLKNLRNKVKKYPKISFAILALLLVGGLIIYGIQGKKQNAQANFAQNSTTESANQITINKKFDVAIKTNDGKPTGDNLHINLTQIEKNNSILIQGKPAKANEGKTFLIISMEIQNDTTKKLTVRPVDMVRLVNDAGKTLAADVYNTDVSAEAVSLKKTRIGYVVESNQKLFKLLIGEVREKQEPIEINFN